MTSTTSDPWPHTESVAGLLAAGAIFLGAFELAYRPFRLAPAAVILLLIATVMTQRQQRLVGDRLRRRRHLLRRRRRSAGVDDTPPVLGADGTRTWFMH